MRPSDASNSASVPDAADTNDSAQDTTSRRADGESSTVTPPPVTKRRVLQTQHVAVGKLTPASLSETQMRDLPRNAPLVDTSRPLASDTPVSSLKGSDEFVPGVVVAGRYEIRSVLGRGGMGAVVSALDRVRNENVAIKVMHRQLMCNPNSQAKFRDEARVASRLAHPNIVRVFDLHEADGIAFITMELLVGSNLREEIENRRKVQKPFSVEEVIHLATQMSEALAYAHKQKVVHLDVKPENIWLSADGTAKLMDFGIARLLSPSQLATTGLALGTAYYMAPEQLNLKGEVSHLADQYALAVVIYEMLVGELPQGAAQAPSKLRRDVPRRVSDAIMRALSGSPANRYATTEEFAAALKKRRRRIVAPKMPSMNLRIEYVAVVAALLLFAAVVYFGPSIVRHVSIARSGAVVESLAFYESGDYPSAVKKSDEALKVSPDTIEALLVRAKSRRLMRDNSAALVDCNRVLELDPKHAAAYVLRGHCYYNLEDKAKAQADFQKALDMLPTNDAKSAFDRAWAHYGSQLCSTSPADYSEVRTELEKIRNSSDWSSEAQVLLARVSQTNVEKVAQYSVAFERLPQRVDLLIDRGFCHYELGHYRQAGEDARQAVNSLAAAEPWQMPWKAHGTLLLAYVKRVSYTEALAANEQVLKIYPNDSAALLNKARALKALSRYGEALSVVTQLIQSNPDYSTAYDLRADIYKSTNDLALSRADYRKALELSPNSVVYLRDLRSLESAADEISQIAELDERLSSSIAATDHFELGKWFASQRDWDSAIDHFSHAIEVDAENEQAFIGRADARQHQNLIEEAISDVRSAIEHNPEYAGHWRELGDLLEEDKGDYSAAIEAFDKAIQLAPFDANLYQSRASTYKLRRDLANATADLQKALVLEPQNCDFHRDLGDIYADQVDFTKALAEYDQAVSIMPKEPQNYMGRAAIYKTQHDSVRMNQDLDTVLRLASANNHALRSDVYKEKKDWKKAEAEADAYVKLYPNRTYPYYKRAWIFNETNEHSKAIDDCKKGLEIEPFNKGLLEEMAFSLQHSGDHRKAIEMYTQLLERKPNAAGIYRYRGNANREAGNYEEAEADLKRSLELDPFEVLYLRDLATVYEKQDKTLAAVEVYKRAIQVSPKDARSHNELGHLYYKDRDYKSAAACYQKAADLDATDAVYWDNLGGSLEHLEEYKKALDAYKKAAKLKPEESEYSDSVKRMNNKLDN